MGIGPRSARDRDGVLDYAKLARAGLFAPQTRSAESLERIIGDYFELPAEVIPFVGTWLTIANEELCRLGGPRASARGRRGHPDKSEEHGRDAQEEQIASVHRVPSLFAFEGRENTTR